MITPQVFSLQWIASPLIRVDETVISSLQLPEDAKRFLREAGLPLRPLYELHLNRVQEELPTIANVIGDSLAVSAKLCELRVLGEWVDPYDASTSRAFVCLNEHENGRIVRVFLNQNTASDTQAAAAFFNTSLPQMLECCLAYEILRVSLLHGKSFTDMDDEREVYVKRVASAAEQPCDDDLQEYADQLLREEEVANSDEALIQEFLGEVQVQIARIDPEALRKPSSVWPNYLSSL